MQDGRNLTHDRYRYFCGRYGTDIKTDRCVYAAELNFGKAISP